MSQKSPHAKTSTPETKPLPPWKHALRSLVAFQGGPRLDDCTQRRTDCGSFAVDFFEPAPYRGGDASSPGVVDLSDDDVFDDHGLGCRADHAIILIGCSNWSYAKPHLSLDRYIPPLEPYVIITAMWQLERVNHGERLDVGNDAMLETYLRKDFEEHLESEGGRNWKARQRALELFPEPEVDEWRRERYLKAYLIRTPEQYERVTYNGLTWLRYIWRPHRVPPPDALIYSRVVSERTILTFHLVAVRMSGSTRTDAMWWKALVKDSEALMSGLTVTEKNRLGTDETSSEA